MWLGQIQTYGRLIKFSHTIFALPFALAAVLLAHLQHPVALGTLGWILLAMVGARSAAMGFNRYADVHFDLLNPRTSNRPLTAGAISKRAVMILIAVSSLVFVFAAAMLGRLCLFLALPVLLVLFFYSYTKRFTPFSHLYLGLAIGLAPVGAWIAVSGQLDPRVLLLSLALLFYIGGFDILYACQDIDFDRSVGLHSIPVRWGAKWAMRIAAALHVLTFVCLMGVYLAFHLGLVFLGMLIIIGGLLVLEHRLVHPADLTHIDLAFFHVNSAISVLLLLAVFLDTWKF
jgi:4-hydroxybenzoate polyprenyltransferase